MKFLLSNIINNKIKLFQTITTTCLEYIESLLIYACCELLVTSSNALHNKADVTLSGQYSNDILNSIPLYVKHVGIPQINFIVCRFHHIC